MLDMTVVLENRKIRRAGASARKGIQYWCEFRKNKSKRKA